MSEEQRIKDGHDNVLYHSQGLDSKTEMLILGTHSVTSLSTSLGQFRTQPPWIYPAAQSSGRTG